jgi:four helix bundle protein
MATFTRFEDIEAWQKARLLTREVYRATRGREWSRDYALRDQVRRAAISMMSNIVEGFERGGTSEFVQFLSIAKGSTGEVACQLYIALDQSYIDEAEFARLYALATEVSRMIGGLMTYLRRTNVRGQKYRKVSP